MKQQLEALGFGFDWNRELATCKPDYYKWEQWFFTRLYEKGLAYKKMATVNWDPVDCTVLANEQVIDGRGWRSGAIVERREIPQWFIKITDYADELLQSLDQLDDWPEQVKTMQANWIGKSYGAEIIFSVVDESGNPHSDNYDDIDVYTTRADTLMGATYVSLAAEHPISLRLAENNSELAAFIESCKKQSVAEADMATMEKKGIDTGLYALHPLNGRKIPIWIANYVLMDYGSGAVMAVPAHDERDFAFATTYDLPIEQVIVSTLEDDEPFTASQWQDWYARKTDIETVNSGEFSGKNFKDAIDTIVAALQSNDRGEQRINFRLRDWGVSRQRYWGAPIPMYNLPEGGEIPVPLEKLPVLLPEDVVMDGVGSPIKSDPEWRQTQHEGKDVEHETDTFDTFMESSWYYARYTCPNFDAGILDPAAANYWLPVDQYVGGIEHAILHLLYARFYHKLLRDEGMVTSDEPFKRLLCQGMVLAESFYVDKDDGSKEWINPADVDIARDNKGKVTGATESSTGRAVSIGGMTKMSKSKNNGVDPQASIDRFGEDTVRVFTMFAAPPEQTLEWNDDGVAGAQRFLKRLWAWCSENQIRLQAGTSGLDNNFALTDPSTSDKAEKKVRNEVHSALEKALSDFQKNQFNTVVAACMTMLNTLSTAELDDDSAPAHAVLAESLAALLRLLAPIAPHICHALWRQIGFGDDVLNAGWPVADTDALKTDEIEIVVQVNGKVRAKAIAPSSADKDALEALALAQPNVEKFIGDKTVRKVIVVPGKLVNIVAN